MSATSTFLLELADIEKTFQVRTPGGRTTVSALDGVSLGIERAETLAVVGESGCGKTTLARVILGLIQPTAGSITFDGRDITGLHGRRLRGFREEVQAVFQDPFDSLDPRYTAKRIVMEPLQARGSDRVQAAERALDTLESVGIPRRMANRHPHEFSGGQRQRIGIARAVVGSPSLVVLDEPTSALDVTVQAQVVYLLTEIQTGRELTFLFISHDLALVRHFATRVAVMYLGSIVESAPVAALFSTPMHPYTIALLSAVPVPDPVQQRTRPRIVLDGELSSSDAQRSGCQFAPRCWLADERCRSVRPALENDVEGHLVACHKPEQAMTMRRGVVSEV